MALSRRGASEAAGSSGTWSSSRLTNALGPESLTWSTSTSSFSGARLSHLSQVPQEPSTADDPAEASSVWTFGSTKYGRLGRPEEGDSGEVVTPGPVPLFLGQDIRSISAGSFVTAFVTQEGHVYMCGKNYRGLFAGTLPPDSPDQSSPIQLDFFKNKIVRQVALGETYCAAVTADGNVWWWGSHQDGTILEPTLALNDPGIRVLACGGRHVAVLTEDGVVMSWGSNDARQLGHSAVGELVLQPRAVHLPSSAEPVVHLACGLASGCALDAAGTVYAWGAVVGQQPPLCLSELEGLLVDRLACCDTYVAALSALGDVLLYHGAPLPFLGMEGSRLSPTLVAVLPGRSVRHVACGPAFLLATLDNGTVWTLGMRHPCLGHGESATSRSQGQESLDDDALNTYRWLPSAERNDYDCATSVGEPRLLTSLGAKFVRKVVAGHRHSALLTSNSSCMREERAWELLESERVYVRSLHALLSVYEPVAKKRVAKMMDEIHYLYEHHLGVLRALSVCMHGWDSKQGLGPIFDRICDKETILHYVRLEKLRKDHFRRSARSKAVKPSIEVAIRSMRKSDSYGEKSKKMTLDALLREPLDRMRHYFWLCNALLRDTPEWHPDHGSLVHSLDILQDEFSSNLTKEDMLRVELSRVKADNMHLQRKLILLTADPHRALPSFRTSKPKSTETVPLHPPDVGSEVARVQGERSKQVALEKQLLVVELCEVKHEVASLRDKLKASQLQADQHIRRIALLRKDASLQLFTELTESMSACEEELRMVKKELEATKAAAVRVQSMELMVQRLEGENGLLLEQNAQLMALMMDNQGIALLGDETDPSIKVGCESECGDDALSSTSTATFPSSTDQVHSSTSSDVEACVAWESASLLATDGKVRVVAAASKQRLVGLLTTLEDDEYEEHLRVFFLVYRSFLTPMQLLCYIIRFYCDGAEGFSVDPSQSEYVLRVVRHWVSCHFCDFEGNGDVATQLLGFIDGVVTQTAGSVRAAELGDLFHRQRTLHRQAGVRRAAIRATVMEAAQAACGTRRPTSLPVDTSSPLFTSSTASLDANSDSERSMNDLQSTLLLHAARSSSIAPSVMGGVVVGSLLRWKPDQVARQMILVEWDIFKLIQPSELLGCAWTKADKAIRAPNVMSMIARFNWVTSWVKSEVLQCIDCRERKAMIGFFLQVAAKARTLGGVNTVMEVVCALNSAPVSRLKQTWAQLSAKNAALYEDLDAFVSAQGNCKAIRALQATRLARSSASEVGGVPCLPYLGLALQDLMFIHEGNPDRTSRGLINFTKHRQLADVVGTLQRMQATPFGFDVHPAVRTQVLKGSVPVLDEDQAFDASYALEPRRS